MSIITYLKQTDIFLDLTNTQLELIASISIERELNDKDIVFDENTTGSELYVIARGEVEIFVTPGLMGKGALENTKSIARLRRGQSFGEVALVDQGMRSAGARAAEKDTLLVVIPRDRLMLLCDSFPELGYRLMRNLAADLAMKIRNTDLQVREYLTWKRSN